MNFLEKNVYSSDSNEWYTPAPFLRAARAVMGSIDLDPASCKLANEMVKATCYYTAQENGLNHDWCGNIWLNPPYGRIGADRQHGQTEIWIEKLMEEYRAGRCQQAILLVNAYLYKVWFAPLLQHLTCFPTGRLAFWNAAGQSGRSPHASALIYFGQHEQRFIDVFSQFGPVVRACTPTPQKTLWEQ